MVGRSQRRDVANYGASFMSYVTLAIFLILLSSSAISQITSGAIHEWLTPERFASTEVMNDTEILRHVNSLRNNPRSWRSLIDTLIAEWESAHPPRMLQHLLGTEGPALLYEVRSFLDTITPARPVRIRQCLRRVATLHARDVARHPGQIGHNSSNGTTLTQRVLGECPNAEAFGECIDHLSSSAPTVILRLLFDPDVPGRGHRATLFDPEYAAVGIGGAPCARHPILGTGYIVVLTFAND